MAYEYNMYLGVWYEDGEYLYNVIQEFEDGERQVLAYGSTDTAEDGLREAAKAVSEAINV